MVTAVLVLVLTGKTVAPVGRAARRRGEYHLPYPEIAFVLP